MRNLFTPEQAKQISAAIERRFRQRMGAEPEVKTALLKRRDGLTVTEGLCPHCRKELNRLPHAGKEIKYACEPCQSIFTVVDPQDEIDRLTNTKAPEPEPPSDPEFFKTLDEIDHLIAEAEERKCAL